MATNDGYSPYAVPLTSLQIKNALIRADALDNEFVLKRDIADSYSQQEIDDAIAAALLQAINTSIVYNYIAKSSTDAAYTAVNKDYIYVDTSLSAFSITLPINPNIGDKVVFLDVKTSFKNNNLTILRNGETIMGSNTDFIININNAKTEVIFTGTDWRIT